MSNRRSIIWLLILCLGSLGLHIALSWCAPAERPHARGTALNALLEPKRITLARRGARPVVLAQSDVWRMVEPYAASVDEPVVLRLLDALLFCTVDDVQSEAELLRNGRTKADFGLAEPAVRILLRDGAEEVDLALGDWTPSSNGVYAAVSGAGTVMVLPASVRQTVDLEASAFRQRGVFSFGPEFVRAFDLKRPSAPLLAFVRVGDGWQSAGSPASAAKVRELLARISEAKAVDFVWPVGATNEAESASTALLSGYGLDPESAVTVVLKCTDGTDRRLSLGASAGEKRVYALIQNGTAVVTLDAAVKDAALQDAALFTDSRVFPFEAATVPSFKLVDGETDYVVARAAEGTWRLEAPVVAAAETEAAESLLARLLSLTASDLGGEGLKVSVTTNVAPVTVSRERLLAGRRLEDLRSRMVLKLEPTRVKRLVSTPGKGGKAVSVVYARDRSAWNVESADARGTACAASIEKVLSAINPLQAERIVTLKATTSELAKYGLDEPFHTVAVDPDAEGAVRRNILIGGPTKGGRFATVGSAEAVFVLSHATVKSLVSALVEE